MKGSPKQHGPCKAVKGRLRSWCCQIILHGAWSKATTIQCMNCKDAADGKKHPLSDI